MEGYALTNPRCTPAVQAFVTAWVNELHALGYLAGVYGSAASTIRDLQALADDRLARRTTSGSPTGTATRASSADPYVSDALWTNHQRLHQYRGGHHETWGGVTIDIDSNYVDARRRRRRRDAAGAAAADPASRRPVESAAGSVTASDGIARVSWPAGAFQQSVVVSLTPALPVEPVDGLRRAAATACSSRCSRRRPRRCAKGFAAPLTIHIGRQPDGDVAPMTSSDGVELAAARRRSLGGAARERARRPATRATPNGSVDIQTTAGGFFALLPEKARPPAPDGLTAHFSHGQLVLSWPKSTGCERATRSPTA